MKTKQTYTIHNNSGRLCEVSYYEGWYGEMKAKIISGVIDEEAKKVFTQGQCHALALALHESKGWVMVSFFLGNENPEYDSPGHVVVRSPKGEMIDIQGIGADVRWGHRVAQKVEVTPDDIKTYTSKGYLAPNLPVAREFVEPLLKQVEQQNRTGVWPKHY